MVTVTLAHTQNPDTEPLYVDVASWLLGCSFDSGLSPSQSLSQLVGWFVR